MQILGGLVATVLLLALVAMVVGFFGPKWVGAPTRKRALLYTGGAFLVRGASGFCPVSATLGRDTAPSGLGMAPSSSPLGRLRNRVGRLE